MELISMRRLSRELDVGDQRSTPGGIMELISQDRAFLLDRWVVRAGM